MKNPELSIVIPAYNEQDRILNCLNDIYSNVNQKLNYEIIVVSDGSTDKTDDLIQDQMLQRKNIRLLTYLPNRGKGFAVKQGVLAANGELVLFLDADGSTPFRELSKLLSALNEGYPIAIGSRAVPSDKAKVKTSLHRKIIGRTFNFLLESLLLKGIYDSQCGFKLFKSHIAKQLFTKQKSLGFSFDYEILFLADRSGFKVKEVAVDWNNVEGSKVNLIIDPIKMFFDLFRIRFWHSRLNKPL